MAEILIFETFAAFGIMFGFFASAFIVGAVVGYLLAQNVTNEFEIRKRPENDLMNEPLQDFYAATTRCETAIPRRMQLLCAEAVLI